LKKVDNNSEFDKTKDTRAIAKYESLHTHNLAQKTVIMFEHFGSITSKKIGGRAKAMVVTSLRLHAVRYLSEFRRCNLKHKGILRKINFINTNLNIKGGFLWQKYA